MCILSPERTAAADGRSRIEMKTVGCSFLAPRLVPSPLEGRGRTAQRTQLIKLRQIPEQQNVAVESRAEMGQKLTPAQSQPGLPGHRGLGLWCWPPAACGEGQTEDHSGLYLPLGLGKESLERNLARGPAEVCPSSGREKSQWKSLTFFSCLWLSSDRGGTGLILLPTGSVSLGRWLILCVNELLLLLAAYHTQREKVYCSRSRKFP